MDMELWHNLLLATIQGLTEFLPISSSAHLIFIPELFGWAEHSVDFDIALHLGTLTAVLYYFKSRIKQLIDPFNPLTQKVIIATIPVCIVGFILKSFIEVNLRNSLTIALATIVFGLVLAFAQYKEKDQVHDFEHITYKYALLIGLAQCLALIPGTSRSGITISAALLLGLGRKTSAEFSFLLSIPVILLASALTTMELILNPVLITTSLYSYILGFTVSAIVAITSMYFFIKLVEKIGMMPFVIYRLILGVVLLIYLV